uniref:Uncharacterized protein n=1 Tax=Oryza brachyantha TaxID=4533 RepID=J3LU13_ORYBR
MTLATLANEMMEPLLFGIMTRAACFIPWNTPTRLMSITFLNSAKSTFRISVILLPVMPALLTMISRVPNFSAVASTARLTSSSTVTSQWRNKACWSPPRESQSFWPASSLMSAIQTFAPCSLKRRTIASPIPEAPPVTSATLPSNLFFRRKSSYQIQRMDKYTN